MIQLHPKSQRIILAIISTTIVILGTYLAIQYGKGYRPTNQGVAGTGLLAANSFPDAAEVYLDDKLLTATDDTINLPPGEYNITIKKEGFIPWNKLLTIKNELVTQTNASLFRSVPSLTPLTMQGAVNIHPSPNGHKLAFVVASASSTLKNGVYVLDLSGNSFPTQRNARQIIPQANGFDLTQAQILWSPDSSQLLIAFTDENGQATSTFLTSSDNSSNLETLPDVTVRLPIILEEWEEQLVIEDTRQFNLLPEAMQQIATQSATNVYFSPNFERLMYTATASAIIPDNIIQKPLVTNTQPEQRQLSPGSLYLYDLKEDRNYLIDDNVLENDKPQKSLLLLNFYQQATSSAATNSATTTTSNSASYNRLFDSDSILNTFTNFRLHYSPLEAQNFQWYPDSSHLIISLQDKIDIIEYDSTNWITIYAGPFVPNFTHPSPDGNKIIIVTNLNPSSNTPTNLYSVDIK